MNYIIYVLKLQIFYFKYLKLKYLIIEWLFMQFTYLFSLSFPQWLDYVFFWDFFSFLFFQLKKFLNRMTEIPIFIPRCDIQVPTSVQIYWPNLIMGCVSSKFPFLSFSYFNSCPLHVREKPKKIILLSRKTTTLFEFWSFFICKKERKNPF